MSEFANFKIKEGVLDKLKSPCLTIDEYIVNAICEMDIDVDKERLVKALTDARSFYNEGYVAAKERYERKWISVEEGLPKKDGRYLVLIYDGEGGYTVHFNIYTNGRWLFVSHNPIEYWMPELETPNPNMDKVYREY